MRIAIDVDDVLCELMQSWLTKYNEFYGTSFTKDQMIRWDLTKNGLDTDVYQLFSDEAIYVYGEAKQVEGAQQAVTLIERSGYEVIYVTSAISGTVDAKIEWLLRYGFIKEGRSLDPRLVITSSKQLVDADVLIDDKPENILRWPYPRKGMLFTQPWNKEVDLLPERAMRVDNWREVLEEFGLVRGSYDKL